MVIVVTQKCPCGYSYKERKVIKNFSIESHNFISCGKGPKFVKSPDSKEELVSSKVLAGDEPFKEVSLYNGNSKKDSNFQFIACPKCGTILLYGIASSITKEEE
ncbi:MAG: hypothetical protein J6M60_00780 [Clostridia bacterium]|nr:hypothetical protein [Clostridia bacterium]